MSAAGKPSFVQLRAQFQQALELDEQARDARLLELASSEPELAQALRRLLAQAATPAASRPLQLPAGTRLGPFALHESIGCGGMGQVYRATRVDGEFSQTVALKVIAPGFETSSLRRRFRRERQILARLDHPHIAHLVDGGEGGQGQLWLALEYVDGEPLVSWCRNHAASLDLRLKLFLDLCAAVSYAHGQLVLHRDIKPGNVLVDSAGRLKLLDFGIASLLDDTGEGAARTRQPAMTVRYAAPEQVREQRCSTATDVYALGVLLFELLAGRSPYAEAQAGRQSWVDAALHAQPDPLHAPAGNGSVMYTAAEQRLLGGELQAIVHKALAKLPSARYASVLALADDIADVRAGRAARSGVGGRRAALRALLVRYRWPLGMVAMVLLALSVGIAVALREAREARAQSLRAQSNFDALLSVLTAASPLDFVGREPTASQFLSVAAHQIDRRLQHDPLARWQALERIGHGLINLGHAPIAADVLRLAERAQMQDPAATTSQRLDLLRLLIAAQGPPLPVDATLATAQRIRSAAASADAPPGIAADALARAASALAGYGRLDLAQPLFGDADALLAHIDFVPALTENIERQRGLMWQRAGDPQAALAPFERAAAVIAAAPQGFTALRRAELDYFLADAYAALGQLTPARAHLDALRPVYASEYPPEHPETARLLQIEVMVALADGHLGAARALAARARSILVASGDAGDGLPVAQLQDAAIALAAGDCVAAVQALGALDAPGLGLRPRRQLERAALQATLTAQCAQD